MNTMIEVILDEDDAKTAELFIKLNEMRIEYIWQVGLYNLVPGKHGAFYTVQITVRDYFQWTAIGDVLYR